MKNFTDGKVRKLNYIVHNPNTVEETAKVLLEICIQANAGKVERKLIELSESEDAGEVKKKTVNVNFLSDFSLKADQI